MGLRLDHTEVVLLYDVAMNIRGSVARSRLNRDWISAKSSSFRKQRKHDDELFTDIFFYCENVLLLTMFIQLN